MNASYAWLQAFVDFPQTPDELRDLLTMRCATVDEVAALRADLAPFVVARVVEAAPHPDSDHLWVTKVDAGTGELLDVVCGAPNVQAGKLYPFARTGTVMPGGLKIEKRKIRGQTSNGMLCSAREMGLGTDHTGILELDTAVPPGTPFLEAMPVGDTRLVIDVTPNRPDLLSHLGIAREIAAAVSQPLALPGIPLGAAIPAATRAPGAEGKAGGVPVRVDEAEGAPRYMGVVIRGVKIGPSPRWLVERLEAVGVRAINNVVDVTNYVLQELGQPTHAFDLAKLAGGRIIVRGARPDEKITTLDGIARTLQPGMTVIADAERAQAIAGIMGGADSEVTDATTDLFLEVAVFDPRRTRATRRALGLSTEASYRFERGVDIELPPAALERAARLITAVAGGTVEGAPVDIYPAPHERPRIALRVARVARVLGEPVPGAEIARLLEPVGFDVERGSARTETLDVAVPPWRPDVAAEVDLIEEVARLRGYDAFSEELRPFRPGTVPDAPAWIVARRLREALVGAGLLEARPMPFVAGAPTGYVRVANPLAENEAYLRRELLDSLARRAEYNLARMQGNVRLFEIGSAFFPTAGTLPREELHAALLVMGQRRPPHFTEPSPPAYDEWDAKGLAELLASTSYPSSRVELRPADADGGALWDIAVDGAVLGAVRRLALDAPVWASPAFGVELSLGEVPATPVAPPGQSARVAAARGPRAGTGARYRAVPVTPAAEVDVALLVPQGVTAEAIERAIRATGGEMLESVALFDEYRGKGVPEGFRSLAWRLTFRHPERTLRDKEVEGRRDRILRTLENELGVRQRTS